MSNYDEHFGSPAKLASCIIENDIETELLTGNDECIRVYTNYGDELRELGRFAGPWEFEEWLCSDLPYEEWKQKLSQEEKGS